jgi:predicted nucleotidyltransferase
MTELKRSIEHLPGQKQEELRRLTEILRDEFGKAIAHRRAPSLRDGRILKIVLFGSHARGTQVVDPKGRYFSDYDLLVVVDHEDLTDTWKYWSKAEDRMLEELSLAEYPIPLTLIVHSIDDINHQLRRGRYFYIDIAREGIALFEEGGHAFDDPVPLSEEEARMEAQTHFGKWYRSAVRRKRAFAMERAEGVVTNDPDWQRDSAFVLHQAAERCYFCILLVVKLYMPKSHNLNYLSKQAEQIDHRLAGVWKRDTKFGQRCFELLRAAYVKSRYSDHYNITDRELDWLSGCVDDLLELTREICEDRLAFAAR